MKKWITFDVYIISMSALFITLSATYSGRFSKTGTFEKAIVGPDLDRNADVKQVPDWGYIVMGATKNHGVDGEDIFLSLTKCKENLLYNRYHIYLCICSSDWNFRTCRKIW